MNQPMRAFCLLCVMLIAIIATSNLADGQVPLQAAASIAVDDGGGVTSRGSGTLVDVTGDVGLVITNWHVLRDQRGGIVVTFPDGHSHGARVVGKHEARDLAALMIAKPNRQPVAWTDRLDGQVFSGVGYGPGPDYRLQTMPGHVIAAYGAAGGQSSISLDRPFREGDSGGGVFNERGELCGVIWGADAAEGFFVHPSQVAEFITQITGKSVALAQYSEGCQLINGQWVCPKQVQQQPPRRYVNVQVQQPVASAPAQPTVKPCECGDKIAQLEARVKELEVRPQVAGPAGPQGPQGERGPAGADGKDAVFDQAKVAAALAAALPPITVEQRDFHTGEVLATKTVPLGGKLTMRFGAKDQPVDVIRP